MKKCENVGEVQQTSDSTWIWTIKNYNSYNLPLSKREVISPKFSALQSGVTANWRVTIYPNGINNECNNFLSIFLTNLDDADVKASYEFSVLDKTNKMVLVSAAISQMAFHKDLRTWGHSKFVSLEFLNDRSYHALTDNTLILSIRILVDREFITVENADTHLLRDDFEKMLDSQKYSDVTIVVGDEKLRLHKVILASRSPVFELMFAKASRQNLVVITIADATPKVVKEMFRYIYAGKVNDITSLAKDLFIVADKYCVEGLKSLCEETISNQLTADNALEYFRLVRTHQAKTLKPRVYKFVKDRIKDMYPKPEFRKIDSDTQDEILGILCGLISTE